LVEASAAVETDKPKLTVGVAKVVQGVVAIGYGVLKRQSDCIELAVADTLSPNEIVDVGDSFLVRLGYKDKRRAPSASALLNPAIVKEGADLIENDLALEDAVAGLTTADWSRCAGVDAEVEAEDGADNAAIVETVPILVDG
jgi:hypothetical protein